MWRLQTESARSRRGRRGSQSGTALVEAGFIMLPFMMFVFAIIEIGLQMATTHAMTGAVKAGSRTASTAVSDLEADYSILQSVSKELSGLPRGKSQIVRIVVYRSTASGQAPSTLCMAGTPSSGAAPNAVPPDRTGACNVYTVPDLARPITAFGCSTSSPDRYWCPTTRKSALTGADGPPDYIGVYIQVMHQHVTGIVGKDAVLTDYAVNRLEPSKR